MPRTRTEHSITELLPRWTPLAVIIAAGAGMLWLCWFRWPDVLIDFSREIYVAWRLAEGQTLYTDIAYFNGPLSPHVNALWFNLFGVSLRALVVCNLAVLGLSLWLLWRLLIRIGGRLATTLACVVHLAVFSLGHVTPMGNFNFVCPYSHEMTHGLTLTLGALVCLTCFAERGGPRWLTAAGVLVGLTLLTRAELALGAVLAAGAGFAALLWLAPPPSTSRPRAFTLFVAPIVLVPAIAFCLLARAMPTAQAARATLGSWSWVFNPAITSMPFYRQNLGTSETAANLKLFALATGCCALVLGALALIAWGFPGRRPRWIPAAVCAGLAVIPSLFWKSIPWAEVGRPLPLAALILLAAVVFRIARRRRGEQEPPAQLVPRLTLSVLAFVLLARMALNAQVFSIGFVLALPASMLVVLALVDWAPAAIARRGGDGDLFRAAVVGLLLAATFAYVQYSRQCVAVKSTRVGQGADAFYADVRGREVAQAVKILAREPASEQTLAVMPEGLMINYLARRPNSSAFVNIMPPEVASAGESVVLADLERRPPDEIILLSDRFSPAGFRFHSQVYAPSIAEWVARNYQLAGRIEAPPPGPTFLDMALLRRAAPARTAVQ